MDPFLAIPLMIVLLLLKGFFSGSEIALLGFLGRFDVLRRTYSRAGAKQKYTQRCDDYFHFPHVPISYCKTNPAGPTKPGRPLGSSGAAGPCAGCCT